MNSKKKKLLATTAIFIVVVVVLVIAVFILLTRDGNTEPKTGKLRVAFLDVGQGDCTLIEMPDGKVILLDCGTPESGDYIAQYLKSRKITKINKLVITHPHIDHFGGAENLLGAFEVETVYLPPEMSSDFRYAQLLAAVQAENCEIITPIAGYLNSIGEVTFALIGPLAEYGTENSQSMVWRLEYRDTAFLFAADMESDAEGLLLNEYGDGLDADVLKVGHHGSGGSSSEEFLGKVTPRFAVISCGKDNEYGHPASSVVSRLEKIGAKIFFTWETEGVVLASDGEHIYDEDI